MSKESLIWGGVILIIIVLLYVINKNLAKEDFQCKKDKYNKCCESGVLDRRCACCESGVLDKRNDCCETKTFDKYNECCMPIDGSSILGYKTYNRSDLVSSENICLKGQAKPKPRDKMKS